ncbi:MAG TPA: hypothetical protein VKF36_06345 [Syntrophorhabdales bacterium]|nr:hypothetical protein [Syntrophorhabdales bacterium]
MSNVCRKKHAMRERSSHWWFWLLLVLGFTAGVVVDAGAEYSRDSAAIPTRADLTMIGGRSKTLVIRLLNLTPYDLAQDTAHITALNTRDTNRNTHKSGMFAPLGWPGAYLFGLHGDPPDNGWIRDPDTGNWIFTPNATNTSTHPYNLVVSWDDQGGYVTNSTMGWIIKGVYASGHGPVTKDVPLRFWFTRTAPPTKPLYSEIFKFISASIIEIVDFIGVAIDPANPIAWLDTFVATKELATTTFDNFNSVDTGKDGEKMYFAAYVVPDGTSANPNCLGCEPSTVTQSSYGNDEATDGVDVMWALGTGEYSSEIYVTTELLRGKDRGIDYDPNPYTSFQDYRLPIVSVTLWTPEQYRYAQVKAAAKMTSHALGAPLNAALGTRDLKRYTQFACLYNSLNKSQRRTLQEAIEAFMLGNPLTHEEVVLVEEIIAAMQNGQITLSPENRERHRERDDRERHADRDDRERHGEEDRP